MSYALEQPEMLRSHDCKPKRHAQKTCAPTVLLVLVVAGKNNFVSEYNVHSLQVPNTVHKEQNET